MPRQRDTNCRKLNTREIERLTRIIIEAGISNDKYDDDTVRVMFRDLEGAIQHLVTRHFNADVLESQNVWPEYKQLRQLEDRDSWLQAHIAREIARSIISDQAEPCFGLPETYEEDMCRLEQFLDEMDGKCRCTNEQCLPGHAARFYNTVDHDELTKWRQQSLSVSELAMKDSKADGMKRRVSAAYDIRRHLECAANSCLEDKVTEKTMEAVDYLLDKPNDIALALRSCSASYCWQQLVVPAKLNRQATEQIHGFGTGLSNTGGGPVEILFGPVYKQVEGEDVLLRKGKVLWDRSNQSTSSVYHTFALEEEPGSARRM